MRENKTSLYLVLTIMFFLYSAVISGIEILIWDNDNESYIEDPEGAGEVGCEYAIQQALIANGREFSTLTYLPMDLSEYDIIFITLGHWCPG